MANFKYYLYFDTLGLTSYKVFHSTQAKCNSTSPKLWCRCFFLRHAEASLSNRSQTTCSSVLLPYESSLAVDKSYTTCFRSGRVRNCDNKGKNPLSMHWISFHMSSSQIFIAYVKIGSTNCDIYFSVVLCVCVCFSFAFC